MSFASNASSIRHKPIKVFMGNLPQMLSPVSAGSGSTVFLDTGPRALLGQAPDCQFFLGPANSVYKLVKMEMQSKPAQNKDQPSAEKVNGFIR